MDKKTELRNQLFEKYFDDCDGIILSELMSKLSPLIEKWTLLRKLLEQNVKFFGPFSCLYDVKRVKHNRNSYLILKIGSSNYLIIDIKNQTVLDEEEIKKKFNKNFFVTNFSELGEENFDDFYVFSKYKGDISELLQIYFMNELFFELEPCILYKLNIGDACTYLSIDLANDKVQLGFETSDQFLYEHLFLTGDLSPSGLQDAQDKIGADKMREIFDRIKQIKIPIHLVPINIFETLCSEYTDNKNQKTKIYKKQ